MLSPLIRRPPRPDPRRNERGVTLALVAVSIFSIIAMAGLSIDVGTLYEASAEAQRAADAAALAAARQLSISGITGAATPSTDPAQWVSICGGSTSTATQTAVAVAQQNTVGGLAVPTGSISVNYSIGTSAGSSAADCSTLGAGFGVNPTVTVKVTQSSLATYFARIWGRTGTSVSASATAEAFNPSKSGSYSSSSSVVPVQPRCVKPFFIPNYDPLNPAPSGSPLTYCNSGTCNQLINVADGSIVNPGILAAGGGVIGETFWLVADCSFKPTSSCLFRYPSPQPNSSSSGHPHAQPPPNLDYLPGLASYASAAVPSDGTDACSAVSGAGRYAQAIAGCDQSTRYQCGQPVASSNLDFTENPGAADTTNGVECLTHQGSGFTGQDTLALTGSVPTFPFQMQAGADNPLVKAAAAASGDVVSSSTSVVSLPIYDVSTGNVTQTGPMNVTVVGFLQVFINSVDGNGNVNVTVMNVAGCGNSSTTSVSPSPLYGSSPVPVRLITPP